jgi:hypothetical protein
MDKMQSISGVVNAPPTANEAGAGSDIFGKNEFFHSAPIAYRSATMDNEFGRRYSAPPKMDAESGGYRIRLCSTPAVRVQRSESSYKEFKIIY